MDAAATAPAPALPALVDVAVQLVLSKDESGDATRVTGPSRVLVRLAAASAPARRAVCDAVSAHMPHATVAQWTAHLSAVLDVLNTMDAEALCRWVTAATCDVNGPLLSSVVESFAELCCRPGARGALPEYVATLHRCTRAVQNDEAARGCWDSLSVAALHLLDRCSAVRSVAESSAAVLVQTVAARCPPSRPPTALQGAVYCAHLACFASVPGVRLVAATASASYLSVASAAGAVPLATAVAHANVDAGSSSVSAILVPLTAAAAGAKGGAATSPVHPPLLPTSAVAAWLGCADADALCAWLRSVVQHNPHPFFSTARPADATSLLHDGDDNLPAAGCTAASQLTCFTAACLLLHPQDNVAAAALDVVGRLCASSTTGPWALVTFPVLRHVASTHSSARLRIAALRCVSAVAAHRRECVPLCLAVLGPALDAPPLAPHAFKALSAAAAVADDVVLPFSRAVLCALGAADPAPSAVLRRALAAAVRDCCAVRPAFAARTFGAAIVQLLASHDDSVVVGVALDALQLCVSADTLSLREARAAVRRAGVCKRWIEAPTVTEQDAVCVATPLASLLAFAARDLQESKRVDAAAAAAAAAAAGAPDSQCTPEEDACMSALQTLWLLVKHPSAGVTLAGAAAVAQFPVWMCGFADKYLDGPSALTAAPDAGTSHGAGTLELQFGVDGRILRSSATAILMSALHVAAPPQQSDVRPGDAAPSAVARLVGKVLQEEARKHRWIRRAGGTSGFADDATESSRADAGAGAGAGGGGGSGSGGSGSGDGRSGGHVHDVHAAATQLLRDHFAHAAPSGVTSQLASMTPRPSDVVQWHKSAAARRGAKGAAAVALLWCFHPPLASAAPARKTSPGCARQAVRPTALASTATAYYAAVRDYVVDAAWPCPTALHSTDGAPADWPWLSALYTASGWLSFTRRAVCSMANAAVLASRTGPPVDGDTAAAQAAAAFLDVATPHLVNAGAAVPAATVTAVAPASLCAGFNAALVAAGAAAALRASSPTASSVVAADAVGAIVDVLVAAAAPPSSCDVTTRVGVLLATGIAASALPATDTVRLRKVLAVLSEAWLSCSPTAVGAANGWVRFAAAVGLAQLAAFRGQGLLADVAFAPDAGRAAAGKDVHHRVVNALYSAWRTEPHATLPQAGALAGLAIALQAPPTTEATTALLQHTASALHHDLAVVGPRVWLALAPAMHAAVAYGAAPAADADALAASVAATPSPADNLLLLAVAPDVLGAPAHAAQLADLVSSTRGVAAAVAVAACTGARPFALGVTIPSVFAAGGTAPSVAATEPQQAAWLPAAAVGAATVAPLRTAQPGAAVDAAHTASIRTDPSTAALTAAAGVLARCAIHPSNYFSPFTAADGGGGASGGASPAAAWAAPPPTGTASAPLRVAHAAGPATQGTLPDFQAHCHSGTLLQAVLAACVGAPGVAVPVPWLCNVLHALALCRLPPVPCAPLLDRVADASRTAASTPLLLATVTLAVAAMANDVSAAQWVVAQCSGATWPRLPPVCHVVVLRRLPALGLCLPPSRFAQLCAGVARAVLQAPSLDPDGDEAVPGALFTGLSECLAVTDAASPGTVAHVRDAAAVTLTAVVVPALQDDPSMAKRPSVVAAAARALSLLPLPNVRAALVLPVVTAPDGADRGCVVAAVRAHLQPTVLSVEELAATRTWVLTPPVVQGAVAVERCLTLVAATCSAFVRRVLLDAPADTPPLAAVLTWLAGLADSAVVLSTPLPAASAPATTAAAPAAPPSSCAWLALYGVGVTLCRLQLRMTGDAAGRWADAVPGALCPEVTDPRRHVLAVLAAVPRLWHSLLQECRAAGVSSLAAVSKFQAALAAVQQRHGGRPSAPQTAASLVVLQDMAAAE